MNKFKPVNAKTYFDYLPPHDNACGDIWLNMPTFGLLGNDTASGIVVSPACDVSNFKTETITYLPIIPLRSYFSTIGFIPFVRREIADRMRAAAVQSKLNWPEPGYLAPGDAELESELQLIEDILHAGNSTKAQRDHLPRAAAGLRVTKACVHKRDASLQDVAQLCGSQWNDLKRKLITNSLKPDVHFLPNDTQEGDNGFLKYHSLVLFRYPLTIPAELLSAAQSCRSDQ